MASYMRVELFATAEQQMTPQELSTSHFSLLLLLVYIQLQVNLSFPILYSIIYFLF